MFNVCLSCVVFVLMGCTQKEQVEGAGPSDTSPATETEPLELVPDSGHWQRDPGVPLLVEARGNGRAWRFSYCGPDGILGTGDDPVAGGHLRLPAGADVVIQLRSDDYIYVFSCPGLKLKEIAVPDLEFSIAFRTDRRGEYDLAMDPMCGFRLPPGETMGTLSVASESDFQLWLAGRPQSH
ncbi:MAG: hypothetical protein O3A19_10750 [Planctomycetota bacterium]|nr:hypothetical protein [Planctomycetota bacterium]